MKRGRKIKQILTTLANGALLVMEILEDLSPTGFTRSRYVNRKRFYEMESKRFEIRDRQELYRLLDYLKIHGFIEKKKTKKGTLWKITASGLNKLNILKENSFDYRAEPDGNLKIIVFDIPEYERKKRAWLRGALKVLKFKILQQSVWIGKSKIPKQFLFDLHSKKLLQYIHILEVGKRGTVKEVS